MSAWFANPAAMRGAYDAALHDVLSIARIAGIQAAKRRLFDIGLWDDDKKPAEKKAATAK